MDAHCCCWDTKELGMVRFSSVQFFNGFWRTPNWTIGLVQNGHRTHIQVRLYNVWLVHRCWPYCPHTVHSASANPNSMVMVVLMAIWPVLWLYGTVMTQLKIHRYANSQLLQWPIIFWMAVWARHSLGLSLVSHPKFPVLLSLPGAAAASQASKFW